MYTIHNLHGMTLYVAENTGDVRTALEEAVLSGADLSRANLSHANLSRAYLCHANLSGANLSGADLSRANLSHANLSRAYLGGAYLSGANLSGANLSGANLSGAHLSGANLGGARLDGGVWDSVASTLKVAINAMNDGGRHWIKGELQRYLDDGSAAYCSVGSIEAHSEGTTQVLAKWLLASVAGGSIESFNDDAATTWQDVRDVFSVAIRHAERFGNAS